MIRSDLFARRSQEYIVEGTRCALEYASHQVIYSREPRSPPHAMVTSSLLVLLFAAQGFAQQTAYGQCMQSAFFLWFRMLMQLGGGNGWSGATTCVSGMYKQDKDMSTVWTDGVLHKDTPATRSMTTTPSAYPEVLRPPQRALLQPALLPPPPGAALSVLPCLHA